MRPMITLALLFFSSIVLADGNELLSRCRKVVNSMNGISHEENTYDFGYCTGYVNGIADMNQYYEASLKNKENLFFCVPQSVTTGQKIRVVVKYLEDNPDKLHKIDPTLVVYSFTEAFPCHK